MKVARTRIVLGVAFWLLVAALSCVRGVSQAVALRVDRTSVPARSVVNLIATVPAGSVGSMQFLEGEHTILTVPVSAHGIAVLSIASLARGSHALRAVYLPEVGAPSQSEEVTVDVAGMDAPVSAQAEDQSLIAGKVLRVHVGGLPEDASGTVTLSEGGEPVGTAVVRGVGLQEVVVGGGEELGSIGPTQANAPVYRYQAACTSEGRLGTLAWLAIPAEYKIFPRDGLERQFQIVSSGGPILVWYGPGRGAFAVDGGPASDTPGPGRQGYAMLRLPVEPGVHTVAVFGDATVLAVGTPPSAGEASVHPTVLVRGDGTKELRDEVALLAGDGLDVRLDPGEAVDDPGTALHISPIVEVTLGQPGHHILDVAYSGDAHYAPSVSSLDLFVRPRVQSRVTFTTSTTSYPANAAIVLSASVAPATATGSILFVEGGVSLGSASLQAGVASVSLSLAPGIHTIAASYSGDSANDPAVSPAVQIQVVPGPVTVTLAPLPAEIVTGGATVLSASVSPDTSTGTVAFQDLFSAAGGSNGQVVALGSARLSSGLGSVSTNSLLPGRHVLSAVYSGDDRSVAGTSPPLTMIVDAIPTTIVLAPVADAAYGSSTTLAATVTTGASGTVIFRDSISGLLGQAALTGANAVLAVPVLAPGVYTFTAAYQGDATHAASTSTGVAATIRSGQSVLVLTASAASVGAAKSVTLSAVLTPASATGTIVFRESNGGTLGQAAVANGNAAITLGGLAVGSYNVVAQYGGDAFWAATSSAPVAFQVNALATATTLATVSAVGAGSPLTFSATVLPADASGNVVFSDAGRLVGAVPLLNGAATLLTTAAAAGTHTLVASYSGDAMHTPSSSAPVLVIVSQNATTTVATLAQTNVPAGGSVVVNVRVACACPAIPAGVVAVGGATGMLANGTSGVAYATVSLPANALGSFHLAASYAGDNDFLRSASGSLAYVIVPTPTFGTLTLLPQQIAVGSQAVVTVAVSSASAVPTGSVTFSNDTSLILTAPLDANGRASATLSPGIGSYAITAQYAPTGLFAGTGLLGQTLTVTPPLALALDPASVNLSAGGTATTTLIVTPLSGFQGSATAQCVSPVKYVTCTVDAPGTLSAPVRLGVHVTAAAQLTSGLLLRGALLLTLPLALLRRRKRLCALAALLLTLSGCASGGNFQSLPTGPQILHLQVTAAGTTADAPLTVNVSD